MQFSHYKKDMKSSGFAVDLAAVMVVVLTAFVLLAFPKSNYIVAGVLFVLAIAYFRFYMKKNTTPLNAKAVFFTIWTCSVALSLLRLHPLQEAWTTVTLICVVVALVFFILGFDAVECVLAKREFRNRRATGISRLFKRLSFDLVLIYLGICILVAFVVEVVAAGYIPLFNSSQSAYQEFGVQYLHYVTVCSGLYPALVIPYLIRRVWTGMRLFENQNIVLLLLLICVGALPILMVSRQLLLMELALSLVSVLITTKCEYRIKFWMLLLFVAVVVCLWLVLSLFRNQGPRYLSAVFELPSSDNALYMSLWQLYLYISFNFDNFDYLVQQAIPSTNGAMSLYPFAVLMGLGSFVKEATAIEVVYKLPTFTTFSILKTPFCDGGVLAVAIYLCLVGSISAFVERFGRRSGKTSSHVLYALFLYSLAISFFTSEFALPVFWVYVFLLVILSFFEDALQFNGCSSRSDHVIRPEPPHDQQLNFWMK